MNSLFWMNIFMCIFIYPFQTFIILCLYIRRLKPGIGENKPEVEVAKPRRFRRKYQNPETSAEEIPQVPAKSEDPQFQYQHMKIKTPIAIDLFVRYKLTFILGLIITKKFPYTSRVENCDANLIHLDWETYLKDDELLQKSYEVTSVPSFPRENEGDYLKTLMFSHSKMPRRCSHPILVPPESDGIVMKKMHLNFPNMLYGIPKRYFFPKAKDADKITIKFAPNELASPNFTNFVEIHQGKYLHVQRITHTFVLDGFAPPSWSFVNDKVNKMIEPMKEEALKEIKERSKHRKQINCKCNGLKV